MSVRHFDARTLARELRVALAARGGKSSRLLVIGAQDDPMLRAPALHEFLAHTRELPQVCVHVVRHGGHAALSMVQPLVTRAVFARFFATQ
jgi:hypothetical protein